MPGLLVFDEFAAELFLPEPGVRIPAILPRFQDVLLAERSAARLDHDSIGFHGLEEPLQMRAVGTRTNAASALHQQREQGPDVGASSVRFAIPSVLRQQAPLRAAIETCHEPVDVFERAAPFGFRERGVAALEKANFECRVVANEDVSPREVSLDRNIVDLVTGEHVIGEARHQAHPRVQFDLGILEPAERSDVRDDLMLIVHPDEHDCEFDDSIIFGIESGRFEIDNAETFSGRRRPVIGKQRVRCRDLSQDAISLVPLEQLCVLFEHGIEMVRIHVMPFGSCDVEPARRKLERYALFSFHPAGSPGRPNISLILLGGLLRFVLFLLLRQTGYVQLSDHCGTGILR